MIWGVIQILKEAAQEYENLSATGPMTWIIDMPLPQACILFFFMNL